MQGCRWRQIKCYGAPRRKLLFSYVVACVLLIVTVDVLFLVTVYLLCYGCLGFIIVAALRLGSDIRKKDSRSKCNKPLKTFQHDVVFVIGDGAEIE